MKNERHVKIMSLLAQNKMITVSRLTELLEVSEITVRRDLDELAEEGKLHRVHGGARLPEFYELEPPIKHRQVEQMNEKAAIARKTMSYIKDGDTIGIESGTTTLALAKEIASRNWNNLTVVTNSLLILNLLIPVSGTHLMFLGGMIDVNELCSNSNPTEDSLKHVHIDTFFSGCRGLHPNFGRTNEMQNGIEIFTVRSFKKASDRTIILADHTKFSKIYSLQLLQMSEIDIVITTRLAPQTMLDEIRKEGTTVDFALLEEGSL
jgi:DeoR/GlpR family transcriptional regulator of sugar metabolism